ncbi:unnamed protein product [Symbiodinium sp. CCMP2592]|nr:unnamed protein product [Symbiodinium sp. CCMP2592]
MDPAYGLQGYGMAQGGYAMQQNAYGMAMPMQAQNAYGVQAMNQQMMPGQMDVQTLQWQNAMQAQQLQAAQMQAAQMQNAQMQNAQMQTAQLQAAQMQAAPMQTAPLQAAQMQAMMGQPAQTFPASAMPPPPPPIHSTIPAPLALPAPEAAAEAPAAPPAEVPVTPAPAEAPKAEATGQGGVDAALIQALDAAAAAKVETAAQPEPTPATEAPAAAETQLPPPPPPPPPGMVGVQQFPLHDAAPETPAPTPAPAAATVQAEAQTAAPISSPAPSAEATPTTPVPAAADQQATQQPVPHQPTAAEVLAATLMSAPQPGSKEAAAAAAAAAAANAGSAAPETPGATAEVAAKDPPAADKPAPWRSASLPPPPTQAASAPAKEKEASSKEAATTADAEPAPATAEAAAAQTSPAAQTQPAAALPPPPPPPPLSPDDLSPQQIDEVVTKLQKAGIEFDHIATQAIASLDTGRAMLLLHYVADNGLLLGDPSKYVADEVGRLFLAAGMHPPWAVPQVASAIDPVTMERLLLKVQQVGLQLTNEALEALAGLPPEHAAELLEFVLEKSGELRDPSKYVVSTIARGFQPRRLRGQQNFAAPLDAGDILARAWQRIQAMGIYLEDSAKQALSQLSTEHAGEMLEYVIEHHQNLRNPSGYIVSTINRGFVPRSQRRGGDRGPRHDRGHSGPPGTKSSLLPQNLTPLERRCLELNAHIPAGQRIDVPTYLTLRCLPQWQAAEVLDGLEVRLATSAGQSEVGSVCSYLQTAVSIIQGGESRLSKDKSEYAQTGDGQKRQKVV